MRMQLGTELKRLLQEAELSQRAIAELLEIDQAEVSKLMNGKFELFSEKRLIGFFDKLGMRVQIVIEDREIEKLKQEYVKRFSKRFIRALQDALLLPSKLESD